jgi:hypothetical protein
MFLSGYAVGLSLCLGINGFSTRSMVPGRKPFVTLRNAAQYIIELPKIERELLQWAIVIGVADAGRRARRRPDGAAYRDDESPATSRTEAAPRRKRAKAYEPRRNKSP